MEPTIHVRPGRIHLEQEGFLHYMAREGRVALRWIIGISLVATLAVMVSPMLFLAPIPALILLASYVLFVMTREVEKRADPVADRAIIARETAVDAEVVEDAAELDQVHPDTMHLVKREGTTGVAILAGVMVIALLIACFTLPWEVVAIGAFVVTAYMLLVAAPVLLGWIEDDIEMVGARQAHDGGRPIETSQPVHPDDRTVAATKRGFAAPSIALVAALSCALPAHPCGSLGARSADDKPAAPKLDSASNPHALLTREFADSGWSMFQASVHASHLLGKSQPLNAVEQVEFSKPPPASSGRPLIDADTNAHALLTLLFQDSGWSAYEASKIASKMLGREVAEVGPESDTCYLSTVTIIYGDSQGVPHQTVRYLNGTCWAADPPGGGDNLGECLQAFPVCLDSNHVHWLRLKIDNSCMGLTDGQCVYVRMNEPAWILCDEHTEVLSCNCFEELDPTECANIEYICCTKAGTGACASYPSGCN